MGIIGVLRVVSSKPMFPFPSLRDAILFFSLTYVFHFSGCVLLAQEGRKCSIIMLLTTITNQYTSKLDSLHFALSIYLNYSRPVIKASKMDFFTFPRLIICTEGQRAVTHETLNSRTLSCSNSPDLKMDWCMQLTSASSSFLWIPLTPLLQYFPLEVVLTHLFCCSPPLSFRSRQFYPIVFRSLY